MGRAPCCSKNSDLNRGAWTAQEDLILTHFIKTHGEGRWRSIPQKAGLKRCGKSCRLRWLNYLRPDIKRGDISSDEEDLIVRLHGLLGNRWSLIAGRLPSRTDNEIKNFWNTHLRKKCQSSLPERQTPRKPKSTASKGKHLFKSIPVKATAVRIKNSSGKYGPSSDGGTSMESNMIKSQSLSMEIDGQCSMDHPIPLYSEACADSGANTFQRLPSMNGLSSPEFDACTISTDMAQFVDQNIQHQVNSFTGSGEETGRDQMQEKRDWVEELHIQEKSSLQWLSLLLLESEEDWEERNNKEFAPVI